MSSRRALLAAAAFAASVAVTLLSGRLDGDWRIDEAHKISETANLSPRAWAQSRSESANPPVGKLIFAAAIRVAGVQVPYDPAFIERAARGERVPPPQLRAAYARALRPARLVSLFATAVTAALIFLLSDSLLAPLFYIFSFLPLTFAATAVFDPLLTLFVVAAALPVARTATWPRTIGAAVLAALAIDVRATGALAIAGIVVLLLIRRRFAQAAAAAALAVALAAAMNPYFFAQFEDLRILLAETGEHRLGAIEKLSFVSQYAFGDWVGIAILIGVVFAFFKPRELLLAWCATIVVLFTAWLPVGYPRYVLVIIPALAVAAAHGYRHGVVAAGHLASGRRRSANTGPTRSTTSYDGNGRNEST